MVVLHLYQDFYPKRGGIEDHIFALAQAQASSSKITSHVLVSNNTPRTRRTEIHGFPVTRCGSIIRYHTPICPSLPRLIRQINPDIIHIHLPCPMAILGYLASRSRAPLIVGYHNDIVQQKYLMRVYKPFLEIALRRASRILTGTTAYLEASPVISRYAQKSEIVPYGIDIAQFDRTPGINSRALTIRNKYGGRIVLFVGRLCYYKGLEYLIPAMESVDGALLIVGVGPWEKRLRELVAHHQLENCHFIGNADDDERTALYHAADMLVLPSTHTSEAFGLVQLQAMACETPVISTDLPGVSTVNVHQKTGLTIPTRSSAAIAESINTLFDNQSLGQRMGKMGRAEVEALYNQAQMTRKIEQVYADVLTEHAHD